MNALFIIVVSTVLIYFIIRHDFLRNNTYSTHYRQLFYEHPVPMWIYRWGTLKFLAVNNAAVSKYGFSRKEFEAMDILSIREPSSIPAVLDDVKRTDKNLDYRGIWQHRKKNGELFYVELYSHTTRYNGKEARIMMAIDIDSEVRNTIKAKDIGIGKDAGAAGAVRRIVSITGTCFRGGLRATTGLRDHVRIQRRRVCTGAYGLVERKCSSRRHSTGDGFFPGMPAKARACWNAHEKRFRLCWTRNYKYVLDRAHVLLQRSWKCCARDEGLIQDVDESMPAARGRAPAVHPPVAGTE